MEPHTEYASTVFCSSVSLTAIAQAIPLQWKLSRAGSNNFTLEAERPALEHKETWQFSGLLVKNEVRLQLAVFTLVMDDIQQGRYPGHTNIMTQTHSLSMSVDELREVPVSAERSEQLQRIILSLMQDLKERREQFSLEAHNG